MATITYSARLVLDLAILVADQTLIDLSRQRDLTLTEDTAKTSRVCDMAASKIESRLGAAGSYDDTDLTIGDQIFLEFGIRYALYLYSSVYPLTLNDATKTAFDDLKAEIEEYRQTLTIETNTPVIGTRDNDQLNGPYTRDWDSEPIED